MDGASRKKVTAKQDSPSKKPARSVAKNVSRSQPPLEKAKPESSTVEQRLSQLRPSKASSHEEVTRCGRCGSALTKNGCGSCARRFVAHNRPKENFPHVPPNPFLEFRFAPKRTYGLSKSSSAPVLRQPYNSVAGEDLRSLLQAAQGGEQISLAECLKDYGNGDRLSPAVTPTSSHPMQSISKRKQPFAEYLGESMDLQLESPAVPPTSSHHMRFSASFPQLPITEYLRESEDDKPESPALSLDEMSQVMNSFSIRKPQGQDMTSPASSQLMNSFPSREFQGRDVTSPSSDMITQPPRVGPISHEGSLEQDALGNTLRPEQVDISGISNVLTPNKMRQQSLQNHEDLKCYKAILCEAIVCIQETKDKVYEAERRGVHGWEDYDSVSLLDEIRVTLEKLPLEKAAALQRIAENPVQRRKSTLSAIRSNHELLCSLQQKRAEALKSRNSEIRSVCEASWLQLCALEAETNELRDPVAASSKAFEESLSASSDDKGESQMTWDSAQSLIQAFAAVLRPHRSKLFKRRSRHDLSSAEIVALEFLMSVERPTEEPGEEPPPRNAEQSSTA